MAVPSLPFNLSDVAIEFGVSAPYSITDFYRGGGNVPDIAANSGVPTSGAISLSDFAGAENSSPPDVTPDAVNWANITGGDGATNANQTISGITSSISISLSDTGGGTLAYDINGGGFLTYSGPFSVANGQTLRFRATGAPASGTVTVTNDSDSSTTLDTFTYSIL